MKNNRFFVSVDFEDWYHLPYLDKYGFNKYRFDSYCDQTLFFFEFLKEQNIKATVFVVGDIAKQHAALLKKIDAMGHEIACHSLHHKGVNLQSDIEFENETKVAKAEIESIIGHEIYGFRAPSFSMTIEKLNILKKLGFKYDASFINSTANEYYNLMDITKFNHVEGIVYNINGLFEFETPTFKFFGKRLPFAGGGFFRLYPFCFYKFIAKRFMKKSKTFMFFVHPYEIVGTKFPGSKALSLKDSFRINIRRKSVFKRFKKAIKLADNDTKFISYLDYIEECNKNEF